MNTSWTHTTVLLNEAVNALFNDPLAEPGDVSATTACYVDATFGRGGHSRLILSRLSPQGRLIAFDKDPDALAAAATLDDARFSIRHQGFAQLGELPDASVAGVNNKGLAARLADGADKITHKIVTLGLVNANAVLHRNRHLHNINHGFDAFSDQQRLIHQASPKRAALDALAGATAVQINLVVAP